MDDHASRRDFLKLAGATAATLAIGQTIAADASAQGKPTGGAAGTPPTPPTTGLVPRRPLGRTGVQVSALCLGGFHIGGAKDEKEAARIIHEAMDAGVNFLDNAWEYHKGKSEEWMGKAIRDRRDKVFLMTKVCSHGRDKKFALQQLDESLKRLGTDHLDLWQIHEVIYDNDPDLHHRKEGAVAALEEAKRQGKVRFVGFTGHKDPAIHLKMLSFGFAFDTCQMPLNCFDASFRSFEQRVLPELSRRGIAAIGMKSLGGTAEMVKRGVVTAEEALRYAMSLPVAATVSGIDSLDILRKNLKVARDFKPMTPDEMRALRARVAAPAADGRFELYKTSKEFDGEPGREQHGFPRKDETPR